jgi:hypothetical protein
MSVGNLPRTTTFHGLERAVIIARMQTRSAHEDRFAPPCVSAIMKMIRCSVALLAFALAGACASSYADSPAYRTGGADPADRPGPSYAPYRVEIVGTGSYRLPTYYWNGRTYVLGTIGERYRVRIVNPTSRRVEAVVSVDGLDAIDGKAADYEQKRGYVIAPYGELSLDGFRTSMDEVATFRFSSVRDSYAGRKGMDRNVGVVGVAFFPERERPRPVPRPIEQGRGYEGAQPPSAAPYEAERSASSDGAAPRGEAKSRSAAPSSRPGLGTEFGERRYSTVDYTTFQRANRSTPSAVLELRYNDRAGLVALGVPIDEGAPPDDDLDERERANPFPRNRFAAPPP